MDIAECIDLIAPWSDILSVLGPSNILEISVIVVSIYCGLVPAHIVILLQGLILTSSLRICPLLILFISPCLLGHLVGTK